MSFRSKNRNKPVKKLQEWVWEVAKKSKKTPTTKERKLRGQGRSK
jgi:hypothetical protein